MIKPVILDGGMGRELKAIGAPFSQPLWSAQALIEASEYVAQAHQNFIDAGAKVITVNSYACVPFHLGEALFLEQGEKLAAKAASIARDLAHQAGDVKVAGCLPPVMGSYRPDLFDKDKAQSLLACLIRAQAEDVDLWLAETISSIAEFEAIVDALTHSASKKPLWVSFTLSDDIEQESCLRSGEPLLEVLERLDDASIESILFNCSTPEVISRAIAITAKYLRKHKLTLQLGGYANNFMPIGTNHEANNTIQESREMTEEEYLGFAKEWCESGATIVGGCCGVGASHIKRLSDCSFR